MTALRGAVSEQERPLLRVVRGNPSAAELAALVALVAARSAGAASAARPVTRPLWRDRTALVHAPLLPRRGAWRASGQPTHR